MHLDYQDINYVASVHPEIAYCHSEPFDPFDKACRRDLSTSSSRVAQGWQAQDRLREESPANQGKKRFFVAFAPQNDPREPGFRRETT
jgi:hypothetical protein